MRSLRVSHVGAIATVLLSATLGFIVLNNLLAQSGTHHQVVQGTVSPLFAKKDAAELSREATLIVMGEINEVLPAEQGIPPYTEAQKEHMRSQGISEEGITVAWASDNEEIRTPAIMNVDSVLKGETTPASIRFTTLGGTVGDLEMQAEGFPKFRAGEKLLIYFQGSLQDETLDPIGVYRIKGTRATSNDLGLFADTDVESLKAVIRQHKSEKPELTGRGRSSQ